MTPAVINQVTCTTSSVERIIPSAPRFFSVSSFSTSVPSLSAIIAAENVHWNSVFERKNDVLERLGAEAMADVTAGRAGPLRVEDL